jgi:pyruvyl transferase EpsO
MAFYLVDIPLPLFCPRPKSGILYLSRNDIEKNRDFTPAKINVPNLTVSDWCSFQWRVENLWGIRGSGRFIREFWQRGLTRPIECVSRLAWKFKFLRTGAQLGNYEPLFRRSLSMLHSSIFQFKKHRFIITDRLHGHILCVILKIPHIFVANAYHKNEAFYNEWTHQIPFCRFVKEPYLIEATVKELLRREDKESVMCLGGNQA